MLCGGGVGAVCICIICVSCVVNVSLLRTVRCDIWEYGGGRGQRGRKWPGVGLDEESGEKATHQAQQR